MINLWLTNLIGVIIIIFLSGCNRCNIGYNYGEQKDGIYLSEYVIGCINSEDEEYYTLPYEKRYLNLINEDVNLPQQLVKDIIKAPPKKISDRIFYDGIGCILIYKSGKDYFSIAICNKNYIIIISRVVSYDNHAVLWLHGMYEDCVKTTTDKNFVEKVYKSLKELNASKIRDRDIYWLEVYYPELKKLSL